MFAICGHVILYQYFVYKSDKISNERVNKNTYNVRELVEVKIPAHTAITQSWTEYELVSGQIEFKNTCYNYVRIKLTTDTIYLVCLPNYEKTRLHDQNTNGKTIDDAPVNKKDHVPFGKSIDLGKYDHTIASFIFSVPVINLQKGKCFSCHNPAEYQVDIPHQPPQMFC